MPPTASFIQMHPLQEEVICESGAQLGRYRCDGMPVEVVISEEKLIVRRLQPMTHNRHKSLQSSFYAIGIKDCNQDIRIVQEGAQHKA